MRSLRVLILCLCLSAVAGAAPLLKLGKARVTVQVGQERIVLRSDAAGRISLESDGAPKQFGQMTEDGRFHSPEAGSSLTLDAVGLLSVDGESAAVLVNPAGTVVAEGKPVYRVEQGRFELLDKEGGFAERLERVEVEVEPGCDRLAAYLILIYVLMI